MRDGMECTEGQGPAARRSVELANPRLPRRERSRQGARAATSGDTDEAQSDLRRAIIRELRLGDASWRLVPTPVGDVTVRRKAAGYIAGKTGRGRYANRILPTLTDPDEVWQVAFEDGTFRTRYIKLYDGPGAGGSLCIVSKLPDGQEASINYIPMNDLSRDDAEARIDIQRIGSLLFRRRWRRG